MVVLQPVSMTVFVMVMVIFITLFGIVFGYLSIGVFLLAFVISAIVRELLALKVRRRLSSLTFEDLLKTRKNAKRMKWLAVERIEIKRGNLILWMSGGKKDVEWIVGANVPAAVRFIRSNTIIPLKVFRMRWNALLFGVLLAVSSLIVVTFLPPLALEATIYAGESLVFFPFLIAGSTMLLVSGGLFVFFFLKPKAIQD